MSEEQTTAPARTPSHRRVIIVLVVGALAVGGLYWSRHTYERLRAKRTLTNIAAVGGICLAERPEIVDSESLLRLAKRMGAVADGLFEDGWGNEIKVIRSTDSTGVHYTVFAEGPGPISNSRALSLGDLPPEVGQAAFVWKDGTWRREYDPRAGGIREGR